MNSSKASPMSMKYHFSLWRFWMLLKVELFNSRRAVAMTFGILIGMFIIIDLLQDIIFVKTTVFYDHNDNYACTLLIGGFILSSLAFNDMGSALTRYRFLTLPVSALEKLICMWLLTSAGWILFFTVIYTLYTVIINPIGHFLFDHVRFGAFDPFGEFAKDTVKYYFVLQGVFLAGAAYFRGYALGKTLVVVVLLAAVFVAIAYFTIGDVLPGANEADGRGTKLFEALDTFKGWVIIKWLFWWVLAPASWLIAYLSIREQEA